MHLFALDKYNQFSSIVASIIVKLTMHTLENVILKHQDQFYRQSQGLVTGDNHSVSLANITMHFIIQSIASDLTKTVLFKRFIDDIIFLSIGNNQTIMIKQCLKAAFSKYGLELSFREASTDSLESEVEFLDVNHVIDNTNPFGFITRNYVKPTAVHRRFLHGSSHHPPSVFTSILIGEAKRHRLRSHMAVFATRHETSFCYCRRYFNSFRTCFSNSKTELVTFSNC